MTNILSDMKLACLLKTHEKTITIPTINFRVYPGTFLKMPR